MSSLFLPFPWVPRTWVSWRPILQVKTEAKKALSISAFYMSCVTRYNDSFNSKHNIFLAFLLSPMDLQKLFLSLTSLTRLNSSWNLAFLTSSLDTWTRFLYCSQVACPCFHNLYGSCKSEFVDRSPMQVSQHFAWLPVLWDGTLLSLEDVIFEY